jgi:hypothetical protein
MADQGENHDTPADPKVVAFMEEVREWERAREAREAAKPARRRDRSSILPAPTAKPEGFAIESNIPDHKDGEPCNDRRGEEGVE